MSPLVKWDKDKFDGGQRRGRLVGMGHYKVPFGDTGHT